jgi:hypothetical protein
LNPNFEVFSAETLWARINFHSNHTMFKAQGSFIQLQLERRNGCKKQLTGLFSKGKVLNYFALQSKVKQRAIHMKEG